jgi:hypothetical protein
MDKTQLLSIEITTECNLGNVHTKCPNRSPERFRYLNTMRSLDDDLIVTLVKRLYREFGFRGVIAWHYYCEPLCAAERMFRLMGLIRRQVPEARFLLWTNGTLLDEDLSIYDQFAGIVMTYYGVGDLARMKALAERHRKATIAQWPLDGRLEIDGVETNLPCTRPFSEMIIDYYGNFHACCYDWKGQIPIGNLHNAPLDSLVSRWQSLRGKLLGPLMAADAPRACRTCRMRPRPRQGRQAVTRILADTVFAPEPADAAESYVQQLRHERRGPKKPENVAVVFVAYRKVPAERLQEHFVWNGHLYQQAKARVYVVTESYTSLPEYAQCVLVPESELPRLRGKPVFSLCKTKNAGIGKALADGAEVLVCMDVDTALTPSVWEHLLSVDPHEAKVPMIAMVPRSLERRRAKVDRGVTNTIAMTALNWGRVQYDEECVGYGADDGIIVTDIRKAGLMVDRSGEAWHVDHPGEANAQNIPGRGRGGCYGRNEGFNPDNFRANRTIHNAKLGRRRR